MQVGKYMLWYYDTVLIYKCQIIPLNYYIFLLKYITISSFFKKDAFKIDTHRKKSWLVLHTRIKSLKDCMIESN